MHATPAIIFLLLLTVGARPEDWPQWRGPNRDGVWREPAVADTFPTDTTKVVWSAPVGDGWSSPVVAGGRVFVADAMLRAPKAQERVQCFDEATGKLLWTYACDVAYPDWAFSEDQNAGPTSTPAVAEGKVYALGASAELLCLDAMTGGLHWRRDLARDYAVEVFRCRASPLVDGDLLIVLIGDKKDACVLAVDRHTGREVWRALNETESSSSPIVVTAGGKRQLIVWTGQSVTSLDPATGTTFWREPMTTSNNDTVATPVWAGDLLLISGLMFKLTADQPTATVLWPENRGVIHRILSNTSTPVIADGHVFSATNRGDLVCLEARTGREVWRADSVTEHKSGPSIHLTPHAGAVFLFTNRGELIRARLSGAGYEELSRTPLIEPLTSFGGRKVAWSPPAYANRRVFVRNERELVCASLAADGR